MTGRDAWRRQLLPLLGPLLLGGCGGGFAEESLPTAFDLAALFPLAEIGRNTAAIAFGEAGAALPLRGFSELEDDADGAFVWGLGDSSELQVEASAAQPLALVLDGQAYAAGHGEPQAVEVELNDYSLGVVEMGWERTTVRLAVPATALRRGENRLQLRYRWNRRPVDEDPASLDRRPLAMAWRRIGFDPPTGSGPRTTANPPSLALPAGSTVSYYLELEPGARLTWDALRDLGREGGGLTVAWQSADEEERRLQPRSSAGGVELPVAVAGLGRLRLATRGDGGVQLVAPVVRSPRPPAVSLPAVSSATAAADTGTPLNVVLYVVDTLRADHLGCYGYARPTSPAIDRFAAAAARFRNATSPSSWTRPAVASILTGLLPEEHGVHERRDGLPEAAETLAERLAAAGWATAGVITNGNLAGRFGLSQGFEEYRYLRERSRRPEVHKRADRVNDVAFAWLDQRPLDRPFLLYLHVTDPHAPYVPPDRWRERFARGSKTADGALSLLASLERGETVADEPVRRRLIDLYDAEVAAVDESFGELLTHLARLGVADSTVVVFTADHGEEFAEHGGWQHGETLFEEQLAVPLLIAHPSMAAGRAVSRRVSTVDIVPTVLAALGLAPSGSLSGQSLLGDLDGSAAPTERPLFATLDLDRRKIRAVIARQRKLLVYGSQPRQGGGEQLYHLIDDPGEQHDLAKQSPVWKGYLGTLLRTFGTTRGLSAEQVELGAELTERLTALGYLQ